MSSSSAAAPASIYSSIDVYKEGEEIIKIIDRTNTIEDIPLRVIDGSHDFYEKLTKPNCNNTLSKEYGINSVQLFTNNNTPITNNYNISNTSPNTLSETVNLNNINISNSSIVLKGDSNIILTKDKQNKNKNKNENENKNIKYFAINPSPTIIPTINLNAIRIDQIDEIIEILPTEGNYILNITGNKSSFFKNNNENVCNDILHKLIPATYYTQDASKFTKEFFKNIMKNNVENEENIEIVGNSFLSHLVDPATTKNNIPIISSYVSYTILYTYTLINNQNIPIYCNIQNIKSDKNSFKITFFRDDNNFNLENTWLIVNTSAANLSPGVNDIASYINSKINILSQKEFTNKMSTIKEHFQKNSIDIFKINGFINWTNFFELLLNKFNNITGKSDITKDDIINVLISFKTIGDQMYYYDSLALKEYYNSVKKTTVITGDSFLFKAIAKRGALNNSGNVLYSSGGNGKRNICYYKCFENNELIELTEEEIFRKKKENSEKVKAYIDEIYNKEDSLLNILFVKIDEIIYNNYGLIYGNETYSGIQINSADRIKVIYSLIIGNQINYISSTFCTSLYYALWKFYLLYYRLLVLVNQNIFDKDIENRYLRNESNKQDILLILNIKKSLESFIELIDSFNYNSINEIQTTILTILDLEPKYSSILQTLMTTKTENKANEYSFTLPQTQQTINNLSICQIEIINELDAIINDISVPNFSCSNYLNKEADFKTYYLWSKVSIYLLTNFFNNFIQQIYNQIIEKKSNKTQQESKKNIERAKREDDNDRYAKHKESKKSINNSVEESINNSVGELILDTNKKGGNSLTLTNNNIYEYLEQKYLDNANLDKKQIYNEIFVKYKEIINEDIIPNLDNNNEEIIISNAMDIYNIILNIENLQLLCFNSYLDDNSELDLLNNEQSDKLNNILNIIYKPSYEVKKSEDSYINIESISKITKVIDVEPDVIDVKPEDNNVKPEDNNVKPEDNNIFDYNSDIEDYVSDDSFQNNRDSDVESFNSDLEISFNSEDLNGYTSSDSLKNNTQTPTRKKDVGAKNVFTGGKTKKVKKLKNVKKYLTKRKVNKIQLNKKKTVKRKNKKILKKNRYSKKR